MNRRIFSVKIQLAEIVTVVLLLALTSCSTVINTSKIQNLAVNYCEPCIEYDYSINDKESSLTTQQDSLLRASLSTHNYSLIQIIGIENEIVTLLENRCDTLKSLLMRQKINDKISHCLVEIDAIASELDCYAERLDQLGNYLSGINDKNQKLLTILSVSIDAITTATAIFTANPYIAVGGGLTSIGLDALTISPKGKKVELPLKRNLLKNIWFNDNSDKEFPYSVWEIINNPNFSNDGEVTMRVALRDRWMQFEFDNDIDSDTEELFFKDGGLYTADDLDTRVHMMKELEAIINTIKQNIRSLTATVNKI